MDSDEEMETARLHAQAILAQAESQHADVQASAEARRAKEAETTGKAPKPFDDSIYHDPEVQASTPLPTPDDSRSPHEE